VSKKGLLRRHSTVETIWDRATRCVVEGVDPLGERTVLDPGVNFFVLALRHLGAGTQWSCEGHPAGFYVMFQCSERLARKIKTWGYFSVQLERGYREYSIRLRDVDEQVSHTTKYGAVKTRIVPWTEKSKSQVLRWAAGAWWKAIGSFPLPETKVQVRAGKRGRRSQ
jgi:hypothetical protein